MYLKKIFKYHGTYVIENVTHELIATFHVSIWFINYSINSQFEIFFSLSEKIQNFKVLSL